MKTIVRSSDLPALIGSEVSLAGHLHHIRVLKNIVFLILRDGSGLTQIVVEDEDQRALVAGLYHESVLTVTGVVVSAPSVSGGYEIHSPVIKVLSTAIEPPPVNLFQPEIHAHVPTILDNAPLTLRHPMFQAIGRISSASVAGFRSALSAKGFIEIHTPKIVGNATESGANVFSLNYFGKSAFLAQSPQMYKQIMVGVHTRVFETGPVFRAEPHATKRHLNEYTSLDMEMGFIEDHRDVMAVLSDVVQDMVAQISGCCTGEMEFLSARLPSVPDEIPVIAFHEAKQMYGRDTGLDMTESDDLSPEEERFIGKWASSEFGSDFVFVELYPLSKRPFYTHPCPHTPEFSNSFDLLFRGLELVTGGQRLHFYEDYISALESRGMDPDDFADYLSVFKYGMPPHGGFGFGLERWVTSLLGLDNIRLAALFPRDRTRIRP